MVIVLMVLVVALLYDVSRSAAPRSVLDRAQLLLAALVAQGVVGYTQYFSHLPAWLVGVHILGAAAVMSAALWFHDGLKRYPVFAETTPVGGVPEEVALANGHAVGASRDASLRRAVGAEG
jgi:cytochrome c oxidase assembly protein subunit 15